MGLSRSKKRGAMRKHTALMNETHVQKTKETETGIWKKSFILTQVYEFLKYRY